MTIQILVMAPGIKPGMMPINQLATTQSTTQTTTQPSTQTSTRGAVQVGAKSIWRPSSPSSMMRSAVSLAVWRDELVASFQENDMNVRSIDAISAVSRALAAQEPDVILLSDELARDSLHCSSVEMLTMLRQAAPRIPVIMLGTRADAMERIICLECGADDYVEMPCNPRELLSRIRNIMRYRPQPTRSLMDLDGSCAFGDFVFNRSRMRLAKQGETVALQESAMSLLGKLAENPMKVLSRQTLIDMLHGATDSLSVQRGGVSCERSLDVVVCRLRRVIETNPSQPKFLQTVRGFGYVFNPSGAHDAVPAPMPSAAAPTLPVMQRDSLRKTARRAVASADTALTMNPWFSEISFPTRYPASEDLATRSPA